MHIVATGTDIEVSGHESVCPQSSEDLARWKRMLFPTAPELAERIMLSMQTTPKYRILNTLYFAFRLADDLLLLTIIVMTLLNNGRLTWPTHKDLSVFAAVGVELFYGVMKYTTKFWILDRLSLYIG